MSLNFLPSPQVPPALRYADPQTARLLLDQPAHLLGVVGYGAAWPGPVPPCCPFVAAPLLPASHGPVFEIWSAAAPTHPCQIGPVSGAYNAELAFGSLTLREGGGVPLEAVIEQAYHDIFEFLARTGRHEPIRFWNYLAAITADEQGLERYRRFNIGRQRAFLARLRQPVPPAASCLGAERGASMIYFLAANEPARAIENPRQISAYDYPPVYGPRSPSFSRAGLYGGALMISGTASIVGHETRHHGDFMGQLAETLENLRALGISAGLDMAATRPEDWVLKIYLRDPLCQKLAEPALIAAFGAQSQRIYLGAEICRTDLLLEIEAFYCSRKAAAF